MDCTVTALSPNTCKTDTNDNTETNDFSEILHVSSQCHTTFHEQMEQT